MTDTSQQLADDKMRAEIAKLAAETARINQDDRARANAQDEMLRASLSKVIAETAKLNNENKYYPLVVGSGATLAIVAIVKLFL